ncbi:MAG TPA: RNase adapter RapZ [Vicinamibacterales bacterium]|nr:RNase adapter RapZ [Vicinamibacterales bacterium]
MTPVRAARKKTRARAPRHAATRFVVVTGLSGSGKTHAIHALEDLGYFCVDNLPTQLIPTFAELCTRGEAHLERVAIVVDVRERGFLSQFPPVFRKLRSLPGVEAKLIFLEANRTALVRRFSETRRPHPLAPDRSVSEGIDEERKKMLAIRGMADVIVDTSNLTVHELRDAFGRMTRDESTRADMVLNLLSFGFKHGAPTEADLVFDVRFLPNPHFVDRLRHLTGRDARVVRFIKQHKVTQDFINRLTEFLKFVLPHYVTEGKTYLTVAIGCTGGQHRSVMIAEALKRTLEHTPGVRLRVKHRDG